MTTITTTSTGTEHLTSSVSELMLTITRWADEGVDYRVRVVSVGSVTLAEPADLVCLCVAADGRWDLDVYLDDDYSTITVPGAVRVTYELEEL